MIKEDVIKNIITFTIFFFKKYFSVKLRKHAQDLYGENCNILMREIKENVNKWRDIPCSWIGRQ